MTCKFCETMQTYRKVDYVSDKWKSEDPELQKLGKYKREYTVAIVRRGWYQKKGKRSAGRSTDYRYRGLGYKLNYCPECGRDLRSVKHERQSNDDV